MKAAAILATLLAAASLAGCATAPPATAPAAPVEAPARFDEGLMVTPQGMTLYTYDRDRHGRSACNGNCVTRWSPLFAAANAREFGDFSIVLREDGRRQWAYKGLPLYRWPHDRAPGERYGDGYLQAWRTVTQPQ